MALEGWRSGRGRVFQAKETTGACRWGEWKHDCREKVWQEGLRLGRETGHKPDSEDHVKDTYSVGSGEPLHAVE